MLKRLTLTLALVPLALSAQDRLDLHHLPLGDYKLSAQPQPGYVFSCQQHFNPNGPGAQVAGPWIHGATWDLTQKIHVQGEVHWPTAQFAITSTTDGRVISRLLTGNGLPIDSPTGNFPVQPSDPAFQIDRNPNSIQPQHLSLTLPLEPAAAAQPSCVPMGMIGVALNGVAIFNAFDEAGRDAVAHEVQDLCNGHPQRSGQYHYHGPSPCLPHASDPEALIGYALDGFGIYSFRDASGTELTNADLDACHGRTSSVLFNGNRQSIYHYVLTREYPYTIACFRGTPLQLPHPHRTPSPPPGFGPPPQ
jgi:hypothetical protein